MMIKIVYIYIFYSENFVFRKIFKNKLMQAKCEKYVNTYPLYHKI